MTLWRAAYGGMDHIEWATWLISNQKSNQKSNTQKYSSKRLRSFKLQKKLCHRLA